MNLLTICRWTGILFLIKKYCHIKTEPVHFAGIEFKNPVGLAAGFDKNGKWLHELAALGFSHVEVGTVTPKAQPGNPKPRLFRLVKNKALINRMGFNNEGMLALQKKLKHLPNGLIVGVNIGKNKDTALEDAAQDYRLCINNLYQFAHYFTINVSSPNTPGLRELQDKGPLLEIIQAMHDERKKFVESGMPFKPVFLKIAPDLSKTQVADILAICQQTQLDGLIISNTTISRPDLIRENYMNEQGGLSGLPVKQLSDELLAYIHQANPSLPLIGSGGVFLPNDMQDKLNKGAGLVQIYTGFIYQGPFIVKELLSK